MKILVFGNLLVEKDNLVLRLIPRLQKEFPEIEFKEFDPTESLENEIENGKLFILDMALGIKNVVELRFNDIEKLDAVKSCSMHDFDLNYNLKLLKKMELINDVRTIAVPAGMKEKGALDQIQLILRKWVAQDMQGS